MEEPSSEELYKPATNISEPSKQVVPDSGKAKSTLQIPTLNSLKQGVKQEPQNTKPEVVEKAEPFTSDQLKGVWQEFAEKRKPYQAEYHLLTQEIEVRETLVVVHLHNPIQETLLNSMKTEILAFLRERLNHSTIQLTGELRVSDEKKVLYTNREKFEHLAEKNPKLKEMKERLGLDTDY